MAVYICDNPVLRFFRRRAVTLVFDEENDANADIVEVLGFSLFGNDQNGPVKEMRVKDESGKNKRLLS